jgi:hypothetical protein
MGAISSVAGALAAAFLAGRRAADFFAEDLRAALRVDLRAVLRVDFLADDLRAAFRVDLRAALRDDLRAALRDDLRAVLRDDFLADDLRAALRVDLRAALRVDLRAVLRDDFLADDLRAALRVDLRAALRVDLRAVLRVDLRVVLRVDLRVDLRAVLRVDLRAVDFLATLFLAALFTAMFPPPVGASSRQCRHIPRITQDPLVRGRARRGLKSTPVYGERTALLPAVHLHSQTPASIGPKQVAGSERRCSQSRRVACARSRSRIHRTCRRLIALFQRTLT